MIRKLLNLTNKCVLFLILNCIQVRYIILKKGKEFRVKGKRYLYLSENWSIRRTDLFLKRTF